MRKWSAIKFTMNKQFGKREMEIYVDWKDFELGVTHILINNLKCWNASTCESASEGLKKR
jgi:hypothetical protein